MIETILATALFALTILFVRATRGPKEEKTAQQS
jgi:hypothetical protein